MRRDGWSWLPLANRDARRWQDQALGGPARRGTGRRSAGDAVSGPLAHRVDGPASAEAVVLLNGGLMTISSWEPVATRLARSFRVVRCDFRGQLLSPGVPEPLLGAHVADVVALLDHLGVDRAHLVGTSFGGEVGLLLAATHPERVRSLVAATVVDVPPPSMQEADRALMEAARHGVESGDGTRMFDTILPVVYSPAFLATQREELERRRESFARLPAVFFAGGIAILEAIDRMDLRGVLGRVGCPTLVVAAEHDGLMPLQRTRAVADAIPGARLVVVEGSGHALVVERQERFVELVLEFLANVSGAGVVRSA